jgi:hypothetical protein
MRMVRTQGGLATHGSSQVLPTCLHTVRVVQSNYVGIIRAKEMARTKSERTLDGPTGVYPAGNSPRCGSGPVRGTRNIR